VASTRTLNVVITGDSKGATRAMKQVGDQAEHTEKRTGRSWQRMGKAAAVGGAAIGLGLVAGFTKATQAAIEAEKSQAKMEAQLRASGISYSKHRDEIDKVIDAHSRLSAFDDEDLQDSFTNIVRITGDVDRSLRLTGLAADFARAKHIDVAKAGEIVGKVAGGNTGILSRYGIKIEEGATASEALAKMQGKFSGQAEAYGKTTAGSMERASVAIENLGEAVGSRTAPLLAKAADAFSGLITGSNGAGRGVRRASEAISSAVRSASQAIGRFVDRNREEFDALARAARAVGNAFKRVFEGVILPAVRAALPGIRQAVNGIVQVLRGLARIVTGILTGDWRRAWRGAKDVVAGALRAVVGVIRGSITMFGTAMLRVADAAIDKLVDGIKAGARKIRDAILAPFRGIGNAVQNTIGKINPFGDGIGKPGLGFGGLGGRAPGGLDGASPALGPVAAVAARVGGLRVTSGKRAAGGLTSSGNVSYHGTGEAVDLGDGSGGPSPGKMRAFKALERLFGNRLAELIYTPAGYSIKDGRKVRPIAAGDHYDHVHAAVDLGRPGVGDGIGRTRGRRPFTGDGTGWSSEQIRNARTIVQVGKRMRATPRQILAALEAALVESNVRNLSYGDRDSVGVFQQRPSQGWKGLRNVSAAAREFFQHAKGIRAKGTAGELAQRVQRSAFPNRYHARRGDAQRLAKAAGWQEDEFFGTARKRRSGGGGLSISEMVAGAGEKSRETVARQGGSSIAPPTWEQQLAEAETAGSIAEAGGSGLGQIAATRSQLGLTDQRIMRVTEALRNRKNMTAAKRLSLTQELGQLHTSRRSLQEQLFTLSAPAASDSDGADNPLVEALQALAEQMDRDREAREAHTRVLDDLRSEVQAQSALAERLSGTSSDVLKRAMVDLVSGGIAGRGIARRYTPGYGVEVRF
jgi:hypothetical protein